MADIYNQHDAAFRNLSAYAILHEGEHVASVTVKYGARVWAYVHWIGLDMTRGFAGGGGYDKNSAAVANATRKMPKAVLKYDAAQWELWDAFKRAARRDDGNRWIRNLELAGFVVVQAV